MLSYVLAFASDLWSSGPCCLKKADSCVKRQQGQQRTTMPCGLYLRIVPTYFLHITKQISIEVQSLHQVLKCGDLVSYRVGCVIRPIPVHLQNGGAEATFFRPISVQTELLWLCNYTTRNFF